MADFSAPLDVLTTQMETIWQSVSVSMSESTGNQVTFSNPFTSTSSAADLFAELTVPSVVIQFHFANWPENSHVVIIPQDPAHELTSAILNKDLESLDDEAIAPVRSHLEAIVQGICLGISNVRGEPFIGSGVSVRYLIFAFPPNLQGSETIVRTNVAWELGNARGSLIWLMDEDSVFNLAGVDKPSEEEEIYTFPTSGGGAGMTYATSGANALAPEAVAQSENTLDIILDIPLDVSVELGRVKMQVKDVVEFGTGSIVELDRVAGEPVDLLVNGRMVAKGEVVVIEDNFGVRITEILSPIDRLKKIGERE